MDLTGYLVQALKEEKNCFLVTSQGGAGKTTALLETYRHLHTTDCRSGSKRILPLYVPLARCDTGDDYAIREYLMANYGGRGESSFENKRSLWEQYSRFVFDAPDSDFCYLLLLDAINENYFGEKLISEMLILAECRQVSIVVTSRFFLPQLKAWKQVRLLPLSEETVRAETGSAELSESILELLKNPFYLSRYHELNAAGVADLSVQTDAFSLLNTYYNWLADKQVKANRTYSVGEVDTFEEQQLAVCNTLLPLLCFEMSYSRKMFFDWRDSSRTAWVDRLLYSRWDTETIQRLILEFGVKTVVDRFGIPLGIFTQVDGEYKIAHEIYRDFLCAKYMAAAIQNADEILDSIFRCSADTMSLLAGALLQQRNFFAPDGTLYTNTEEMIRLFLPVASKRELQNGFSNYCFVAYNLLEGLENGTPLKRAFCLQFVPVSTAFFYKLKLYLDSKRMQAEDNILELLRAHAEILRRIARYKEAVEVTEYLGEQCRISRCPLAVEYLTEARHDKVMCHLHAAFDDARADGKADGEAAMRYRLAIDELQELSREGYTQSRNLHAMLLSFPDAVSERFLQGYFGELTMKERREEAFHIYLQSMKAEYKRNFDVRLYQYPMQQCLAALLHKDVSCCSSPELLNFMTVDELIWGDLLEFCPYDNRQDAVSFLLAEKFLLHLKEKKDGQILDCLYAKLMILRGDQTHGEIMARLQKSMGQPLSVFMASLLQGGEDLTVFPKLTSMLRQKSLSRSPDAFDVIYIQEDLAAMWELFLNRGRQYSDAYRKGVEELLQMNLREE